MTMSFEGPHAEVNAEGQEKTSGQKILESIVFFRELHGSPIQRLNEAEVRTALEAKGGDFLARYDHEVAHPSEAKPGNPYSGSKAAIERLLIEAGIIPKEGEEISSESGNVRNHGKGPADL